MKQTIQPRLGTVVTMIIGILFLFLIFSQAGKYHKSGYIVEKAEERLALREERKKVMLQIGVNDDLAIKVNPLKIPFNSSAKEIKTADNTSVQNKQKPLVLSDSGSAVAEKKAERLKNISSHPVYVVKQGDTLFGIAQKVYGDGNKWRKILSNNKNLTKPNQLRSGMKLSIPEPTENNTAYIKWQKNTKS